ncbi:carbohydrate ABC transporter permease [bacterium 0.1xD8-71]|nr:carbohydrate ABC transporter permease [bacterium 0.1xD8-71]
MTKWKKAAWCLLFVVIGLIWLMPVFYLINVSVKPAAEFYTEGVFSVTLHPTLTNFAEAWRKIGTFFFNSVINVVVSVPLGILIASLGAYALARLEVRGKGFFRVLFMMGMLLPVHVTLLPNYITLQKLNLLNSRAGILLLYTVFNIPFAMYMLQGFFMGLSREIEESAIIDGAGSFQIYLHIALPMARPAIIISGLLCFIAVWNDLVFAMTFVQNNKKMPITAGLLQFVGEFTSHYEKITAGILLSALPVFILYLFFQKQIMEGMAEGAVKG